MSTGELTKHYYASGQRIAMRTGDALYWVHGDHLGSTVLVTDDQEPGEEVGREKYYPYGIDYAALKVTEIVSPPKPPLPGPYIR